MDVARPGIDALLATLLAAASGVGSKQAAAEALSEHLRQYDGARRQAEERDTRHCRIRAELLAIGASPQFTEPYMRQVVVRLRHLLGAIQVVYWQFHPEDDSLSPRFRAVPEARFADVAVPQGLFEEAVTSRLVRTAAIGATGVSGDKELRVFLLGPVWQGRDLLGVFQVHLGTPTLDANVEDALAVAAEVVAVGLKSAALYERLSYQASHDPLTGLANRRTFQQFLDRELKLAERHRAPLSLLVLDVDHFKQFNDTFGHPAGDAMLTAIAETVLAVGRSTDIVARYGGEEFVIVLPHTDREGAQAAASKILEGIRQLQGRGLAHGTAVTASVGVATLEPGVGDGPALFQRADQALYRAKQSGRDRVCVEERAEE